MRWLKFAVLSLLGSCLWAGTLIQTDEGSRLEIPDELFFDLSQTRFPPNNRVVTGTDKKGTTIFAYIRTPKLKISNPPDGEPMGTGIHNRDIITLLGQQGIKTEHCVAVYDVLPKKRHMPEVYRIENSPLYPNHVLLVTSRVDKAGSAHFLLMGPFKDFYRISPSFLTMVDRYHPGIKNTGSGEIQPWMVVCAIVLLVINITVIWLGFREIAHPRELRTDIG